jgi:hypothetical protein
MNQYRACHSFPMTQCGLFYHYLSSPVLPLFVNSSLS